MSTTTSIQEKEDKLISEEVREIISIRPHWLVRQGNTIFLFMVLMLLFITWLIRFPDVIDGTARLVAFNAPKLISARMEGRLQHLMVKDQEAVREGQNLAILQSTADGPEVLQFKAWLDSILGSESKEMINLVKLDWPAFRNLGELQPLYGEFMLVKKETEQLLEGGYYQKKRGALRQDLQYLTQMKSSNYEQKGLLEQDQRLQQKELEAYEVLAQEKVIAPLELNQYKSKLITKDQALNQVQAMIANSNLASLAKEKELLELQKFEMDQVQQFSSSLLSLKSRVEDWIQKYVLKASQSGKVHFMQSLQAHQQVAAGQELFYIQSSQVRYSVELMVPQKGIGKVKEGQLVLLKAAGYPFEEFGYLKGKVVYISSMPNRTDSFMLKAELTNGLQTSEGKDLYFRNYLVAKAEIITRERRLIERFFGKLVQMVKG